MRELTGNVLGESLIVFDAAIFALKRNDEGRVCVSGWMLYSTSSMCLLASLIEYGLCAGGDTRQVAAARERVAAAGPEGCFRADLVR